MTETIYYSITLSMSRPAPSPLFQQDDKSELYLSANGALCGLNKMAHLDSPELAKEFIDIYMPRLQKRYGADVRVGIVKGTCHGYVTRISARILKDSAVARKRIETGILAPNIKP